MSISKIIAAIDKAATINLHGISVTKGGVVVFHMTADTPTNSSSVGEDEAETWLKENGAPTG